MKNIYMSAGKPTFTVDKAISADTCGKDARRCLSLYAFPKVTLTPGGTRLVTALNSSFGADPDVVLFSPSPPEDDAGNAEREGVWGKLHWTLMQIQGFNEWKGPAKADALEEREEFGRTVKSYFPHKSRIKIRMCGVIAVRTGLVVVGIPDANINEARDRCRARMNESPSLYPLKEPFLNDIVHSTILRVCGGDGTGPKTEQILKIAEDFKDVYLGDAFVDELSVGEASWRMMDDELLKTPPMWSWRLGGEEEEGEEGEEGRGEDDLDGESSFLNCVSSSDSDALSTSVTSSDDGDSFQRFSLEDVGWKRPTSSVWGK